jgi:hypothetical protein
MSGTIKSKMINNVQNKSAVHNKSDKFFEKSRSQLKLEAAEW